MSTEDLLYSLSWVQPELLLSAFAMVGTLLGALLGARASGLLTGLAFVALISAGVLALYYQPAEGQAVFAGAMMVDAFASVSKAIIAFAAAATLLMGADHFARLQDRRFEFPLVTVLAVLGMFIMVSANDLITLYVGVELQSLAAYVLAAWRRDDARSSEAGLKYFVLGALSSGLLLFGCSYVYGFAGSVQFDAIAAAAAASEPGIGLIFGLVLVLAGLAFKMSAAPFHMWTPDVYEGAPTPITALFAAAPKVAAVMLMARMLYEPFADMQAQWQQVVAFLAGASMVVGSFAGLVQTNLKRLMAYSSIANMGFVLMAMAAGAPDGAEAALIYVVVYVPATIGVFAIMLTLQSKGEAIEQVDDLAGLGQRHVAYAGLLTILVFSLAGIPPLAGFWGKYNALLATLGANLTVLAVIGAICAVVSLGYYLRILSVVWFSPAAASDVRPVGLTTGTLAIIGAALAFVVLNVAMPGLEDTAEAAVRSSFLQ
jgi:NADH-quinone oxidoreductase subunit N